MSKGSQELIERLRSAYPDARCELDYRSPWQLLVATVLSAQSTDARVNTLTPALFRRWPGPHDLARARLSDVQDLIRPAGLFRSKARSLKRAAQMIVDTYQGKVPKTMEELTALPAVGPKTAKVILGEAFAIPAGVAVDTHVRRLARRLGLSRHLDPERIAADIEGLIPPSEWVRLSLRMVLHGRRVCTSRNPRCEACVLAEICPKIGL
jgi:endonuclease-3